MHQIAVRAVQLQHVETGLMRAAGGLAPGLKLAVAVVLGEAEAERAPGDLRVAAEALGAAGVAPVLIVEAQLA